MYIKWCLFCLYCVVAIVNVVFWLWMFPLLYFVLYVWFCFVLFDWWWFEFLGLIFQLKNPHAHKPPFKFATVPHGSTETNLMNNYPEMYLYMKPYNKSDVQQGVKAVKDGWVNVECCHLCQKNNLQTFSGFRGAAAVKVSICTFLFGKSKPWKCYPFLTKPFWTKKHYSVLQR